MVRCRSLCRWARPRAHAGRVVAACLALALPALARAQSLNDWPQMDPSALDPRGQENVLLDISIMPETYYRLDALGTPITGERLSTWVNLATRSFVNGRLRVVTSFRYDLDSGAEFLRSSTGDLLVQPDSYALMAAYVEYEPVDSLQLRVGRQFYSDMADFFSFDGARVNWKLPAPVPLQLEVYGGLRSSVAVTEGAVASSLYELDGVAQENGVQPLVGVGLRWVGNMLEHEEGSIGFRQSWDTGVPATPFGLGTSGTYVTAQEMVASLSRDAGPLYLSGGLAWELALDRLERAKVSVIFPLARVVPIRIQGEKGGVDLTLDYQRFEPVFTLDSIFNYFAFYPYDEGALGVMVHGPDWRAEAHVFTRVFYTQTVDANGAKIAISPGTQPSEGARVAGAMNVGRGNMVDAGAQYQDGFGGREFMIDGGMRGRIPNMPLEAYGRVNVSNWDESLLTENAGTSFGVVGGATWRLPFGLSISLILEETVVAAGASSALFESAVPRVFGVFDFSRWL